MPDLEEIAQLLTGGESYYLVSHMRPDGDSVGSLLALGEALQQLGKRVKMFIPGAVPEKYAFLRGSGQVGDSLLFDGSSHVVALDCSDLGRVEEFRPQIEKAPVLINIDHHVSNRYFGTVNLVDTSASATGEIIYSLLMKMGVELTLSMADALYVALATDTGSFKFSNTTSRTHRIAADLVDRGVQPGSISRRVFDLMPLPHFILLKEILSTLELYCQRRIAVLTAGLDLLRRCRAREEDMEGIINYSRNIEGVELGLLFYVEGDGEVKVGFRSSHLDVSRLAGVFGGGGHPQAAGCRVAGSYQEVKTRVLEEAEVMLRQSGLLEG